MNNLKQSLVSAGHSSTERPPGPFALLKSAWSDLYQVRGRLLLVIIFNQVILSLVAFPIVHWLFRESLRANGMYVVDLSDLAIRPGFPITVLLLVAIILLLLWILVLQFSAYLVLLHEPNTSWKDLVRKASDVGKKVFKTSSVRLALYVLVLLPLSGFGFTSALIRGISVPNFITGELEKEPVMRIILVVVGLVLAYLNIRLAVTMPVFALSNANGKEALASSWRMTRGLRAWPLVVAVVLLLAAAAAVLVATFYIMLLPTVLADRFAPAAAEVTAAFSLALAQVFVLIISGAVVAMLAGILTAYAIAHSHLIEPTPVSAGHPRRNVHRAWAASLVAVAAIALGLLQIPTMRAVASHPDTIVLAHRGFTQGGVENTIEALEAAHAAGADMVEMDVMQTKDGQFVVMHDPDLGRLTGKKAKVRDLTLDELTSLTVSDGKGHTGQIPSLVEYVSRANELGQPLLMEIKLSGAETPNHVEEMVAVLEENDLLDGHIFHTLDRDSAQTLKSLRPDQTVGYIMPFAGIGIPATDADFLVLEESSATPAMKERTRQEGLGYFVWTVNTEEAITQRLREGVDGIVTDHPDWAIEQRQKMHEETGLAPRLRDTLSAIFTL